MVRTPDEGEYVRDTFKDRIYEVVRVERDSPGSPDGMLYLARPGARARHQRRCEAAADLSPDDRPHMFRDDPTPPVPGSPYILRVFRSLVDVGAFETDVDYDPEESTSEQNEKIEVDAVEPEGIDAGDTQQAHITDTLEW